MLKKTTDIFDVLYYQSLIKYENIKKKKKEKQLVIPLPIDSSLFWERSTSETVSSCHSVFGNR